MIATFCRACYSIIFTVSYSNLLIRSWLGLCGALLIAPVATFSQSPSTRIEGVSEPPELSGEPKKVSKPTEAEKQLFEIIGHLKDEEEIRLTLPKMNEFIDQHPDYSDAYFLRATCEACILNSQDLAPISADVEAAMSHPGKVYNDTDYYSLLGKIALKTGHYGQAVDDLEKAMTRDLSNADKMFNIEGIEPEKSSKFCIWNLTDLDTLVAKSPRDYRSLLFRGLYYEFFTTFKEDYYEPAKQEFQKAAQLNPKSPLPHYFIGELFTKASFWTKKAAASDANRDEASRNAVQAYTSAIQLDIKFLPAYQERASAYLTLKLYPQAIKDYDRILELDPENATAYSDRGLAKLETSKYFAATIDFREAIQREKEGASYLKNLYENRGDAYAKQGIYEDAIADYSSSIERDLAGETFLLSLKQFRSLYPEYGGVPDGILLRKINALFWPEFDFNVFAEQLAKNGKWQVSFVLSELYAKRGDTYLKASDFRRGVLDFERIFVGIPNMAGSTDRWRELGQNSDGDLFLDVKTAEFPKNGPARFWIKTVEKNKTQTVAYEVDCNIKKLSEDSAVTHDSNGKVLSSSDLSSGWQIIIPDTLGEQLYNGACSTGR